MHSIKWSFFMEKIVENNRERGTHKCQPRADQSSIKCTQASTQENGPKSTLWKKHTQYVSTYRNICMRLQSITPLQVNGICPSFSLKSCPIIISHWKNETCDMLLLGVQSFVHLNAKAIQPNYRLNLPGIRWWLSFIWRTDKPSSANKLHIL